ncbi:MAG: phosphate ABC transporter substrate-binding protein PstS [Desulfitobacterium hafniense]|nr:phosphate ABC transporter substrate-binding protein PstS [Desulfitobacterium hafniense]
MFSTKRKLVAGILTGILAFSLVGCGTSKAPTSPAAPAAEKRQPVTLNGAGATFPFPLYSAMFEQYKQKVGDTINYQSVGSGAGIKQISEQTVDFGGSDGPMTNDQLKAAKGGELLHIPATLGATAVAYNLPGDIKDLKLAPDVLVDIFLGKIKKWNDARIKADNAGVSLPDLDINVAYRSDGSGTTFNFVDYLSAISPEWKEKVGVGTSVKFPVGVGGKGNAGVAGVIKQTPGTIGYVELAYAKQNKIPVAVLKNKAGKWVAPSLKGASAAAAGAEIPADYRVSIVNAPGDEAYPISTFTWLLVYKNQTDKAKGEALVNLVNWMVHDGQNLSEGLDYAKLPSNLVTKIEGTLKTITYNGQPLLK